MELELKTNHISCYDTVLDVTLTQEETLESIVPDACPDIQRIVDTEGMVCLERKEALEGRVEVGGSIRCAVPYIPEGETELRRVWVSLPFTAAVDHGAVTAACRVKVLPRVQFADARSLNPRKVLVRAGLAVELQVYAPNSLSACRGVECEEKLGLQQWVESQNTYAVIAVEEKPFTFVDELAIPAGRPAAAELLKTRAELVCGESKIIGSKLIFKGEVRLELLCRQEGGGLCPVSFALPFSQIMEVAGAGEEADCGLDVVLTGCDCLLDEMEGRSVEVSLAILAQAVVCQEQNVELLSDAYSTLYDLESDRAAYTFRRLAERAQRRVMVRELLETPAPVREVCDLYVNVGTVRQTREDSQVTFGAECLVNAVCRGDDGEFFTLTRTLQADCPVELPQDCTCTCRCLCQQEQFAAPAASGVEVRFPVEFCYLALQTGQASGITALHLDDSAHRDSAGQPSIVLRMVSPGERLWDIAKAHSTTVEDIIQANALSEEELPSGQLLLIPKKR